MITLITLILGACSGPSGSTPLDRDATPGEQPDGGTAGTSGAAGVIGSAGASGAAGAAAFAGAGGAAGLAGAAGGPVRFDAPAGAFAVAAAADTLAIAHREPGTSPDGASEGRLLLQLFDQDLAARGGALELDRQPSGLSTPSPTLATDGTDFLVCWSPQDQVRCFRVGRDGGSSLLFQTDGVTPAFAFHAPTWAVAYAIAQDRTSTTELRVVRLASNGSPVGDVVTFPYNNYFFRAPSFVSTPSGFALLAGTGTVHLYRLGAELAAVGAPFDTGLMPWASDALAATDDEAAMAVAFPYGNALIHVRGGDVVMRDDQMCCGKTGGSAALAVAGSRFAVAWWGTSGRLSFFEDIDGAKAPLDDAPVDGPALALVVFGSRTLILAH